MSISFLWHNVQFEFWCMFGQKMCFLWLPMYWAYLKFKVWDICAYVTFSFFQKRLEKFVLDLVVG